jgi:hypothetical protein
VSFAPGGSPLRSPTTRREWFPSREGDRDAQPKGGMIAETGLDPTR